MEQQQKTPVTDFNSAPLSWFGYADLSRPSLPLSLSLAISLPVSASVYAPLYLYLSPPLPYIGV